MNQNPEQKARGLIDAQRTACEWTLQNKNAVNLAAGIDISIREYQTAVGPADYILFVNKKPVGLLEAQLEEGVRLTMMEEQSIHHTYYPYFEFEQKFVQEIESRLSVCDKIEETITDSLKQAEALRQSILKKAFERLL